MLYFVCFGKGNKQHIDGILKSYSVIPPGPLFLGFYIYEFEILTVPTS